MDNIVQFTFLEILGPLLGFRIFDNIYGFRFNHSCHDVLKRVKNTWLDVRWLVVGNLNLERCSKESLLKNLDFYMDSLSIDLIRKFWKAGYVEYNKLWEPQEMSESRLQCTLISSVLVNLSFLSFDFFVVKDLFIQFSSNMFFNKKVLKRSDFFCQKRFLIQVCQEFIKKKNRINRILGFFCDGTFEDFSTGNLKVYYLRYAHIFLLGYTGKKQKVKALYGCLKEYLEVILGFFSKNYNLYFCKGFLYIKFLGILIWWVPFKNFRYGRAKMIVPVQDILIWFVQKGYCVFKKRTKNRIRATSFRQIINQSICYIVQKFNKIFLSILVYYSFVNLRSDLWKICNVLRKVCGLTLAKKLKLRSAAQVFQKFGRNICIRDCFGKCVIRLCFWPKTLKTVGRFRMKRKYFCFL